MTLASLIAAIDVPLAFIFLSAGIFLSIITNFPQFRKFKDFIKIIQLKKSQESTTETLSPLHALYTAMSTSLGMGNIISPAVAISIGGPGALFWIAMYAIFGSVTKFTEVVFAVKYKRYAHDGSIMGGPTGYLYQIHPFLANWYGILSIFLFSAWSALQSKTLAITYNHLGVDEYISGTVLALFIFMMLMSGTKTIGNFAAKIVPLLFIFYIGTAFFILGSNIPALKAALAAVFQHAFSPTAAVGGFAGASMLVGLRQGIFKGAFTTEAGVGTAAIPHAYSATDNPIQQGILGMYSIFMNTFLCMISGLIALTTNVWQLGIVSNDLAFIAFKQSLPNFGPIALIATITICILGATLGNSFNGSKCFGFFTNNKGMTLYYCFVSLFIFLGAIMDTPTLWRIADLILPLIVLPNLFGIIILTLKHRKELSQ
ncbi:sodium:alanine symporter family protein [Candidatus Babeliales bacterium]|nr:sodium:alanine symporter family protein [Candidatus Babeliales bacterium]